jgi:hypothetical protein
MSMVTASHILRRRFQPSIARPAIRKPYFIQFIPPAAADARSGTEAGVGKVVALTLLDASQRPHPRLARSALGDARRSTNFVFTTTWVCV